MVEKKQTMASELILMLQEVVGKHGDLPILTNDSDLPSSDFEVEPGAFDGRYCFHDIEDYEEDRAYILSNLAKHGIVKNESDEIPINAIRIGEW